MPSRWKNDRPLSRAEFEARFPDDAACALYLAAKRWPGGFVCPSCDGREGWELRRERITWQCTSCGRQTSVTAGTFIHGSHVPLRLWFMAVHIITSHSNGISALQLQAQLGLGSYKSAWLMLQKLRRAMVDPHRSLLQDLVEVDESELPFRSRNDPAAAPRGGRSPVGKMFLAGAVELSEDGHPGRIRLAPITDFSAATLRAFLTETASPGTRVITDGWLGYERMPNHKHEPKVVGSAKAHEILNWVHRVFANLKTWALGVYHGLRKAHLPRYLDEFVFRWNRRRHTREAFDSLLGIGTRLGPATYRDFVDQHV